MNSRNPSKFKDSHDPAFTVFAKEVAAAIARNKDGTTQKQQVEELVLAEKLFHEMVLSKTRVCTEVYKKFIQMIRITNNNILSARPYFRETSDCFSEKITPALKANDYEAIKPFAPNFHLVKFIMDNWIGIKSNELKLAFRRVERARTVLIENNMPLAIFFRKSPKGHLSFMDMIEISGMGLAACVDKYCGEYKPNYMGVAIGRIVGNLIDANSETVMHFYPSDRRILYRARSIRGKQGITDIVELTKTVNASFELDRKEGRTAPPNVTQEQLSDLLSAASIVSADSNIGEDGYGVYNFTASSEMNAEQVLDRKQLLTEVVKLSKNLPIIHQKVLRLKGIGI
jgi:DNA-directed RNA polymerase specialized sigma subunit